LYPRPDECRDGDEEERPTLRVSDPLSGGETGGGQRRGQGEAERRREAGGGARRRAAAGNLRTAEEMLRAGGPGRHRGPSQRLAGEEQPVNCGGHGGFRGKSPAKYRTICVRFGDKLAEGLSCLAFLKLCSHPCSNVSMSLPHPTLPSPAPGRSLPLSCHPLPPESGRRSA